jgi:hypothetical protein
METALSDCQLRLSTERFQQIISLLDGDTPGRRAGGGIAARLSRYRPVRIIELAADKQPDQISEHAIHERLTNKGGTNAGELLIF